MYSLQKLRQKNWKLLGLFALLLTIMLVPTRVAAQGCVIARGGGGPTVMDGEGLMHEGEWQVSLSYRWLYSDRHFYHRTELPQRKANGSQVINDSHYYDLTATYALSKRWSLNLTVPFVHSDRSSLYEHDGVNRYHTQAGGLGDIRMTAQYWLINPETYKDGNIAMSLGFKAPTGENKAVDTFHRPGGPVVGNVDSSIQPGDGGWGAVLEMQAYHKIYGRLFGYANGSYLFNPDNRYSIVNFAGAPGYFSIPDSYLARAGFDFMIWPSQGLSLSLGARMEGVPEEDLIGGSGGFRRPGYAVSIEPGLTYTRGRFFFGVTTPVAIERNRHKTHGAPFVGFTRDAAFADYTVNITTAFRF